MKTAKYRKVESVFMKKVWQQWAIHLPTVLVKICVQEYIKIASEGTTFNGI